MRVDKRKRDSNQEGKEKRAEEIRGHMRDVISSIGMRRILLCKALSQSFDAL